MSLKLCPSKFVAECNYRSPGENVFGQERKIVRVNLGRKNVCGKSPYLTLEKNCLNPK